MPTFRIKEAAELLGVSSDTVRRWAEDGRIEQTTDASGRLAVDGVSLARFAQERAESAAQPGDGVVARSAAMTRAAARVPTSSGRERAPVDSTWPSDSPR